MTFAHPALNIFNDNNTVIHKQTQCDNKPYNTELVQCITQHVE